MKRINLPILRRIPVLLLVLIVALIALRVALPGIVKTQLNKALANDLPDYTGHVEDVGFTLLAGAYRVGGLTFKHRDAKHDLVEVKDVRMNLSWRALFHKHVLFDVLLVDPKVVLLDTDFKSSPKKPQADQETNYKEALNKVIPFDLQNFEVENGSIHFTKVGADPEVHIVVDQLNGRIEDIGTALIPVKGELPTTFRFTSRLQEHAKLAISGHGQFLEDPLALAGDVTVDQFQLDSINNFLREYGYFDLTRGALAIKGQVAMNWPKMDMTYLVKLQNLKVIAPHQKFIGARGLFTELGLALTNLVVRDSDKVVDTELHIHGSYPDLKLDKWLAVKTLIN